LVKGALRLDRHAHSVTWSASPVSLTALEFAVLSTLLARPEMVFSREQLIVSAYGAGMHVSDRTIDSHVRNIRAKFLAAGCSNVIATLHGVGFRLGATEESS
jgi:two-component system, OmpR family, response regulator